MTAMSRWLDDELPRLEHLRRDLHAHPELGMGERRTAALVAAELRSMGIATVEHVGRFGVVGSITGAGPGTRAIGLRADMDALPIAEQTGLEYASTVPGTMHACGHDGHTTMLLGAAHYLSEHPDFGGTVHLIFQPAEETLTGARAMIEDGLFERFPCDAIFGMHNTPDSPVGHFSIRTGPMFAAADTWSVVFRGRGGHGGLEPHLSQDIVYAQAQFVTGLQGIIGRNVPPTEMAVLSVGHLSGGTLRAANVIPAELRLDGTLRCYSAPVRQLLERRLRELAAATAGAWGCSAEVNLTPGVGALLNRAEQTQACVAAARDVVGPEHVVADAAAVMASEDFAYMLDARPGALIGIGSGLGPDAPHRPLHTPIYDFNDAVIPYGIRYWVRLVQRELAATAN